MSDSDGDHDGDNFDDEGEYLGGEADSLELDALQPQPAPPFAAPFAPSFAPPLAAPKATTPAGGEAPAWPQTLRSKLPSLPSIVARDILHAEHRDIDGNPIPNYDDPSHPFFVDHKNERGYLYDTPGHGRTIEDLLAFCVDESVACGFIDTQPWGNWSASNERISPNEREFLAKTLRAEVEHKEDLAQRPAGVGVPSPPANAASGSGQNFSGSGQNFSAHCGDGNQQEVEDGDKWIEARQIAHALRIEVLGHEVNEVRLFGGSPRRVVNIPQWAKTKRVDLIQFLGDVVLANIRDPDEEDDERPYTLKQVHEAISLLASSNPLTADSDLGVGVWRIPAKANGDLHTILINHAGADVLVTDDSGVCSLQPLTKPRFGKHILDYSNDAGDWYNRERINALLPLASDPEWREKVFHELHTELLRWNWKTDFHARIAAGLLLATWVQTVFAWRPQVFVKGGTGTGKSTFFRDLIGGVFGSIRVASDNTTEAALRQHIRNSGRVIVLDEFDQKNPSAVRNQAEILKMLRSAGGGGQILKGTADQKGAKFSLRHIAWIAAIHSPIKDPADANRFVVLELCEANAVDRGKLVIDPEAMQVLGEKLFACALHCADIARQIAPLVRMRSGQAGGGMGSRMLENYAVPFAMLTAMEGPATIEEGVERVMSVFAEHADEFKPEETGEAVSDERQLLDTIFGSELQVAGPRPSRMTIYQAVYALRSRNEPEEVMLAIEKALHGMGMRLDWISDAECQRNENLRMLTNKRCIVLHTDHFLRRANITTYGAIGASDILSRWGGAVKTVAQRRIGGRSGRGLVISLEWLDREGILSEPENGSVVPFDGDGANF